MIGELRKLVKQALEGVREHSGGPGGSAADSAEGAVRLAAAALLVEMMRADFRIGDEERHTITELVARTFALSREEAQALLAEAETRADDSVSLYEFTRLVNEHLDPEAKAHLVELLWRVAWADGRIDKYEEHLVRKVADLIYVPHREFIRAKHRACG